MKYKLFIALFLSITAIGCKKAPTAAFYPSKSSALAEEEITFNNLSTNSENFTWSFGDGTTSNEESPKHAYTQAGDYSVTLIANSKNEKKVSSAVQQVQIFGKPLVASFSVLFGGFSNTSTNFHFVDSSTGNPTAWIWNFGDGATSNEQSPYHQFSYAGYQTVTLTITKGNISSTYQYTFLVY